MTNVRNLTIFLIDLYYIYIYLTIYAKIYTYIYIYVSKKLNQVDIYQLILIYILIYLCNSGRKIRLLLHSPPTREKGPYEEDYLETTKNLIFLLSLM